MSSRFAQNCASCHAPGRVNVEARERRCSLSCQGCHTNPSGGGLRNYYGKWTQERWLRSAYISGYKMNKPRPQPTGQQFYGEANLKNYLSGVKDAKEQKRLEYEGIPMRQTLADLPESDYDRHTTGEKTIFPLAQARQRIPQDDPWRLQRQNNFNASADLRWFYLETKTNDVKRKGTAPMGTDISVSATPVNKLTLVWEGRFMADPRDVTVWDEAYTSSAIARSAYVLLDDLPYNTYLQYGLYRPMFGHYNPDHTTLFSNITGLNQRSVYKVASIGTAPNVPFLNVHFVQPFASHSQPQDRGYVINAGARFVTLGAYFMASWWVTTAKDWTAGNDVKRDMFSVTGGFTYKGLTLSADVTRSQKETMNVRKDAGTLITVEPRYRVYRENYLKGSYEKANVAPTLREGSSSQWGVGVSSFLISSLELEFMVKELKYTDGDVNSNEKMTWFQTHFFF